MKGQTILIVCVIIGSIIGIILLLTNSKKCPNNCSSNGTCDTKNGVCKCNTGYRTEDCSIKCPGKNNDCNYPNGVCNTEGKCICESQWMGDDCLIPSKKCPDNCSSHGTCDKTTGQCTCDTGWTDINCSKVKQQCIPKCSINGTCNETTGKCICKTGWKGVACSLPEQANTNLVPLLCTPDIIWTNNMQRYVIDNCSTVYIQSSPNITLGTLKINGQKAIITIVLNGTGFKTMSTDNVNSSTINWVTDTGIKIPWTILKNQIIGVGV